MKALNLKHEIDKLCCQIKASYTKYIIKLFQIILLINFKKISFLNNAIL